MSPKDQGAWAELCFTVRAMEERLAAIEAVGGRAL